MYYHLKIRHERKLILRLFNKKENENKEAGLFNIIKTKKIKI
jgi:hypothetical protein